MFRFGIKFCLLTALFYALSHAPLWNHPLTSYLAANARVSSAILNLLGQNSSFSGSTIQSPGFAITVDPTCSGFEFVWFVCAAMLAFPAAHADRVVGILAAACVLLSLNVLRIVSLFLVGTHLAAHFDAVHVTMWPGILVVATLLLMVGWIRWSRRRPGSAEGARELLGSTP